MCTHLSLRLGWCRLNGIRNDPQLPQIVKIVSAPSKSGFMSSRANRVPSADRELSSLGCQGTTAPSKRLCRTSTQILRTSQLGHQQFLESPWPSTRLPGSSLLCPPAHQMLATVHAPLETLWPGCTVQPISLHL